MSMDLSEIPLATLISLVNAQSLTIYNTVAASAWFFYEFCITFADEVDMIWRPRWSSITVLFFLSRYLTMGIRVVQLLFYANITGLIKPDASSCRSWVKFEIAAGHLMLLAVDVLLAVRVYAFYGQDKRMLFILLAVILGGQVAAIVIITIVVPGFVAIPSPLPPHIPLGACVVLGADHRFPYYLLPTVVVETILSLFITAKFIRDRWSTKAKPSPMMTIFIRDGLWAYALVFGGLLWTFLAYRLAPQKGDVAITWLYSVLGFSGTRLILNLRSEAWARKRQFDESGVELANVPTIAPVVITTTTERYIWGASSPELGKYP